MKFKKSLLLGMVLMTTCAASAFGDEATAKLEKARDVKLKMATFAIVEAPLVYGVDVMVSPILPTAACIARSLEGPGGDKSGPVAAFCPATYLKYAYDMATEARQIESVIDVKQFGLQPVQAEIFAKVLKSATSAISAK
jgi:hypothetical protein